MKNKDKYDLSKIEINVYYDVNGCGRKIETHRYVSVWHDGELILDRKKTKLMPYEFLLKWLEKE